MQTQAFVTRVAAGRTGRWSRHDVFTTVGGDINATVTDDASLDELLVKIKEGLRKLGPLIDLEAIREPQGSRTEGGSTVGNRRSGARARAGLLDKIKDELRKLGPLIDLEAIREPQGSRSEGGSTVESRVIKHGWRSRA